MVEFSPLHFPFLFLAGLLLLIVSLFPDFCTIIRDNFLLERPIRRQRISFGAFGYTGTGTSVGYSFNSTALPEHLRTVNLNNQEINELTIALVLHPIISIKLAIVLALSLFVESDLGFRNVAAAFISLWGGTFILWILDIALWTIARTRFRQIGAEAQYGNATWMTLVAFISLTCAFIATSLQNHGSKPAPRRSYGRPLTRLERRYGVRF
ncbi:hypothetical protein M422DRAFT_247302 [Sphaerobolus stellatus SS14]|nr:hypothetical protein M422DRAFT_247302 [Sphaerobolus stellatus SS14]